MSWWVSLGNLRSAADRNETFGFLTGPPAPATPPPGVSSCERLFSATTFSDFSKTFHSLIVLSLVDSR